MKKQLYYLFTLLVLVCMYSCKDEDDMAPKMAGLWQQEQLYIDDVAQTLTADELNTNLLMEINGVYRLYDGVTGSEHPGTWLFSDGDWLNMSMDKIQGKNADNSYRFGQVLVRFTILSVNDTHMELRIKTYLHERKKTVMFNLMQQDDTTGMTGEELIELDTANKRIHSYRYIFKKVNL